VSQSHLGSLLIGTSIMWICASFCATSWLSTGSLSSFVLSGRACDKNTEKALSTFHSPKLKGTWSLDVGDICIQIYAGRTCGIKAPMSISGNNTVLWQRISIPLSSGLQRSTDASSVYCQNYTVHSSIEETQRQRRAHATFLSDYGCSCR
jgi:hypothetical protein